jgi:hypothetical protein
MDKDEKNNRSMSLLFFPDVHFSDTNPPSLMPQEKTALHPSWQNRRSKFEWVFNLLDE